jgi:signal peptide peptidase SppA
MNREQFSELMRSWLARIPIRELRDPAPVVGVLRLAGMIGRAGPAGGGMTLAGLERSIDKAFASRNLVAVALAVNSPGGSPVQSALIARRIRQIAREKGIPVIAFAEDVAASGGYWLACAADEIYADENSIIGSIGVISSGFGLAGVIERLGIERRLHKSGDRKGMFDPFSAEQPEDIARLHSIQADMHESFREMVRVRRGDKLKAPEDELFEGDIWTGSQALALGLIDGIGDIRTVMRERFGERVKLRPVAPRSNPLGRWLGRDRQAAGHHAWEVLAALEEWAQWRRFGL